MEYSINPGGIEETTGRKKEKNSFGEISGFSNRNMRMWDGMGGFKTARQHLSAIIEK